LRGALAQSDKSGKIGKYVETLKEKDQLVYKLNVELD
jgi:hypothetical protein